MSLGTVVLFFLASVFVIQVQSSTITTHGREFVFAFFPERDNSSKASVKLYNDVYISSLTDTDCTLSYNDGVRKQIQVHIQAGRIARRGLPDNSQLSAGTTVENKGITLNCTDNVWVYAYNREPDYIDSSDAFTVIPIQLLSTEYLVPSQDNNPIIGVVATSPYTTVDVHLRSTCKIEYKNHMFEGGDVITFILNANDVLQIVHSPFTYHTDYDCDFSGTMINSSSPTAVFSGSVFYYANQKVGSHLMLQVPSFSAFSNAAIVPNVPSSTQMNIRVLANHDNTSVNITALPGNVAVPSILLKDRGDVFDYNYTAHIHLIVNSDKPVMVVHNTFYLPHDGDLTMFVPGTRHYDNEYLVQSLSNDCYYCHDQPVLTIVSETSEIQNVFIDGKTSNLLQWEHLSGTIYSVGTMTISQKYYPFHVNSTSPILVRLHQYLARESYGFIAGYGIPNKIPTKIVVKNSVHLQCLQNGLVVSVDFSKLFLSPKDLSSIYLGPTCTGTIQGDRLVFNVTYDQCHTEKTVEKDHILFKNSAWYAPLSADNVIRDVQWIDDIICSHPLHGTDSVHIYPKHNATSHVTTSGQIQGAHVHISLYKDASFQTPFIETKDKAKVGQPIYVQVAAPSSHSLILIINYCHAHLTSDPGNSVSHPLISQGCPVDVKTQILASRNLRTRFKFEMFTLPLEHDGIYVTCDVTFCSTMDFSPHCQLGCHTDHTDQHPGIVGK